MLHRHHIFAAASMLFVGYGISPTGIADDPKGVINNTVAAKSQVPVAISVPVKWEKSTTASQPNWLTNLARCPFDPSCTLALLTRLPSALRNSNWTVWL